MFFFFFFLLFLSSLFFFEAVFGHLFFFKNREKSVSGRLGGTPPVGKNAFREVLAARSLPRHVSESILRRCWDPSWVSKFYIYVKKPSSEGSKRGPEAFLKGVKKGPQEGMLLRSIFPRFLEHFRVQLGLQNASQHAYDLKLA